MIASNNPPAFPFPEVRGHDGCGITEGSNGMSLRDWFAGQIAGGMAAHSATSGILYGPGDIANRAYEVADALITARKVCVQCGASPVRDNLDGDDLCQSCCDKWARGEGIAAQESAA